MTNKVINNKNYDTIFRFYRPVLIVLLLCGYNYNFYKDTIYLKIGVKSYCILLVSLIIYASIDCCPEDISQMWSLMEYTCSVLVILFSTSQVEHFFLKLTDIDLYLRINIRHYYQVRYRLLLFTLITWVVRFVYTFLYCSSYACYNVMVLYGIRQYSLLALDLNRVWRCFMFDAIRYRLKILRIRLEESPECNYYLYVKNFKSIKENKMKFCLYMYRSIADLVDLMSPELHASLLLSVAGSLPKLITNVYHILSAIEGHEPFESLGYISMHVIQLSLLLFSPFVAVEFYSVEVEKIQLFLMHRLIDKNDPEQNEDIEMFLRYTQIRTFKYKIFRIIPINLTLPLELINLCTNYVIVLINFTHLYG
ncbi:uncharacterized protein LOC142982360 [Anticarsia gemmatalis]|uniref:uncharacterized protein LOC142982360 n=1 Tax=Anticarsia gemmatalis TaxID=129554 RepID=UPI003F759B93